MIKRERLTPRNQQKRTSKSVSPQNIRIKSRNKENIPTQRKSGKQQDTVSSKDEQSLQICLNLANHHRKEAEQLKTKNVALQQRLRDQMQDMEGLRKELTDIKMSILHSHTSKKQLQTLRVQNTNIKVNNQNLKIQIRTLTATVEQLSLQNRQLKSKMQQTQSVMMVGQSKCEKFDINTLTLAKQSRRQHYANNYQSFSFVPSAVCLQCSKKENELEQARQRYCDQLRQLQDQVNILQRTQLTIQVMESQMVAKNECIDYLMHHLSELQTDSKRILQSMTILQGRLQDITLQNSNLKGGFSDRLCHSFSKTVA